MQSRTDETGLLLQAKSPKSRQQVLANLFTQHRDRLSTTVQLRLDRRLQARVDPSDVLQDAFLEASRRLEDFLRKPEVPIIIWLRFLVLQKLQDFHRRHLGSRKRDARRESPRGLPEATSAVLAESLVSREPPPSAGVSEAERKKAIEKALETLSPLDREILALRCFEGLTGPEVAHALGMKAETVRSRYLRALDRLRRESGRRDGGKGGSP